MLVIRLRRIGRKKDPHYRIVVTEHTAPVQGSFIAEIGHYHPKSKELVIKEAEMKSWLDKGAKPSNTVARLAQRQKLEHKQIIVEQDTKQPKEKAQQRAKDKAEKAKAAAEAPAVEETPAEESAAEETPTTEETPAEEPATEEAPATEATAEGEATEEAATESE